MEKLAYAVPEAAQQIGISRAKAYELIKAGQLRSFLIGSRRLISRDAIYSFIKAQEAA